VFPIKGMPKAGKRRSSGASNEFNISDMSLDVTFSEPNDAKILSSVEV